MSPESERTANEESGGFLESIYPFLVEIRNKLRLFFLWFLIFALLGFVYYNQIVTVSLKIFRLEGVNFAFTSPFQFIDLAISCALAAGTIASLPLILVQILSFLKPALRKKEFRFVATLVPLAVVFFVAGFFYGVSVMKYVINLFYENTLKLGISNLLDVSTFLSQIIMTSSLMGLAFEFPIILTALLRMNVLNYHMVASKRSFVYFGCLLFAALLPPTDVLSLVFLTMPLIFFFESTLIVNRFFLET